MKHSIPHDLDIETARKATERAFQEYAQRFPEFKPSFAWSGERLADISFNAKGVTLRGSLEIVKDAIALRLDVPLVFKLFQKQAVKVIEEEVRTWLDKARAGAL